MLIFLVSTIIVLYLMHRAVYVWLRSVFRLDNRSREYLLYLILFFFVSIFASTGLAHAFDNLAARAYMFASWFWVGLLINLLMAAGLCYLLHLFFKFVFYKDYFVLMGKILLGLVVLTAVYGYWNATHPRVKHVSIDIPGIPEVWKEKTVVQLTDVHLGKVLAERYIFNLVDKVNALEPDIILVTGDLFDGMRGVQRSYVDILQLLKAREGKYFIAGNHETYIGLDYGLELARRSDLTVLDNELAEVDGVQLVGITFFEPGQSADFNEIMYSLNEFDRAKFNILLFHSPINIAAASNLGRGDWQRNSYLSPDVDFQAVKGAGFDLQLSGHTHAGQIFPLNLVTHWMYGGFDRGLNYCGNFPVYTSPGTGVWGPTMRTGSRSEITVLNFQ